MCIRDRCTVPCVWPEGPLPNGQRCVLDVYRRNGACDWQREPPGGWRLALLLAARGPAEVQAWAGMTAAGRCSAVHLMLPRRGHIHQELMCGQGAL